MFNVLHLTHTDITSDSRIIKEMETIAKLDTYKVFGIGVTNTKEKHKSKIKKEIFISQISLYSRNLRFLPPLIQHIFSLAELTLKMVTKSIKIKPDIIHCNDTLVLPLGVLIKTITRAKLIYDAHELESDRNGLSKLLGNLTKLVEKLLWPYIDRLIVVSPSINRWYMENIGYKDSAVILNSPIPSEKKISLEKDYLRKKFSIPTNNKIFIYVGLLSEGRNIDLLLEVFKSKKIESHVVFLGYGPFEKKIIEASANYDNIHLHTAVPHDQIIEITKNADFGLCLIENISLSDYYCLPNKLFEYAFSEIPVIASNFPDIKKIVDEYELGKCTDLDITSIQIAINYCEKYPLSKIESGSLHNLSWQYQERKIINLYNSVLNFKNISSLK